MNRYLRQAWLVGVASIAACGTNPADDPQASHGDLPVQASAIAPGMHRLRITFAGTGAGFVSAFTTDGQSVGSCTKSCALDLADGTVVDLFKDTPSVFAGWTGACTSSDFCEVTMSANQHVTATFDHYDREVATLQPAHEVRGVAFAADGNLIVATDQGIEKDRLDGKVAWSTALTGGAYGVAVDAGGRIYAASADMVYALTAGGGVVWRAPVSLDVPQPGAGSIASPVQISPDGSVVAVRTTTGTQVFRRNGHPRFAVSDAAPDGLAVGPDGTVALGVSSAVSPDQLDVRRYTATGAALPPISPLPGDRTASLAYDAAGDLGSATSAFSHIVLASTQPYLTQRWTTTIDTDDSTLPQGIVFDAAGDLIAAYHIAFDFEQLGLHVEQYDPSGTLLWSVIQAPADPFSGGDTLPATIASDGGKRVAIGGSYNAGPWIAVYQMP